MLHSPIKKRLLALAVGSSLSACTSCPAPTALPLRCHHWSADEILAVQKADGALAADSALHPVVKDYERLCANLS